VFKNIEFGEIRTIDINGQPWWVLKDICKILELTSTKRVAERLAEDEVSQTHFIDSIGRRQKTMIISESGLYAVILRSDKQNANV
jgi:prophage antirepressor-like protein